MIHFTWLLFFKIYFYTYVYTHMCNQIIHRWQKWFNRVVLDLFLYAQRYTRDRTPRHIRIIFPFARSRYHKCLFCSFTSIFLLRFTSAMRNNISEVLPILCRPNITNIGGRPSSFGVRVYRAKASLYENEKKKNKLYVYVFFNVSSSKTNLNNKIHEIKAKSPLWKNLSRCI